MKMVKRTVAVVVAVVILGVLGMGFMKWRSGTLFGTDTKTSNTQIVQAVTKEEQVVLLSLGIQGIVSQESEQKVFGVAIPGSDRAQFVEYSYLAKLGIEGKDVKIAKTGDKAYKVSIPDFIFIGHDKEKFRIAVEKDGALSWATPQVDTAALVSKVLSEDAQSAQLTEHREDLQAQAKTFYTGIIKGIEPEATVTFEFSRA